MKKIYIQDHSTITGAGKWIYEGYKKAWESLGYEAEYIYGEDKELIEMIEKANRKEEYSFMITDGFYNLLRCVRFPEEVDKPYSESLVKTKIIDNSKAIYMFSQPTNFPDPWGTHPNFVSACPHDVIDEINQIDNVKSWTWGDFEKVKDDFYSSWDKINKIPLAFDNISYEYLEDEKYKFDVCFVGGRANNGFDEKYSIMMEHFSAFKDSSLKCGFFVGRNLTHEQENKILFNSKVSINIHDAYQRKLGLDTNERTFKSLGLTGVLVSDKIEQINNLFPDVKTTNDAKEMVKFVKEYVNMPEKELQKIKTENRKLILEKHTYTNRVKQLLDL
tara:strand:+ start:5538 stop:6533 length:996 start_codon:yes stop_codon:yes gene_type:complete